MSQTDLMQTWTTVPDKATWGAGPWVDEPDKAQWVDEATGLVCLAKRSTGCSGSWCGYVGVPPGHPWHGRDYSNVDVEVHGGLTYADRCQEDERPIEDRVCHIPAPGEPDDVWWFGFDCAHWLDISPQMAARERELGIFTELPSMPGDFRERYRTLDYVRAECTALAEQLADAQGELR